MKTTIAEKIINPTKVIHIHADDINGIKRGDVLQTNIIPCNGTGREMRVKVIKVFELISYMRIKPFSKWDGHNNCGDWGCFLTSIPKDTELKKISWGSCVLEDIRRFMKITWRYRVKLLFD